MKKLIKSLDFNGAQPQLSFFNNDLKFKTIQGGIISIITYIIGFAYFFYLMSMWITYQIPPTVINQLEFYPELRQLKIVQPLFVFVMDINQQLNYQYSNYDEVVLQENGEIYKLYINSNSQLDELTTNPPKFECNKQADTSDYFDPICINLNDQYQTNLRQNYQNRTQDTFNTMFIEFCDPAQDNKCISHEQQNLIFDTLISRWRLTLITQDVNLQTGAITNIPQDLYFETSKQSESQTLNFNLLIQKGTYIIDDGIIFPNLRQIEIVRSIELQTTIINLRDALSSNRLIAQISYSLDRKEEVIRVTHPKLGLILAELGYSFQLLLFLGLIMNKYNTVFMNAMVIDALLKIYFPDFKLFEFRHDWKGKIKSIYNKGDGHILNKSDEEYMLRLRKTLGQQVQSKLNYINILYELSRIQLLLQMMVPRQQILISQDLGYKVKLPEKYVFIKDGQADKSAQDLFLDQEQYEDFQRKIPQQGKQGFKKQYTFGDSLSPVLSPISSGKISINLLAQLQQKFTHSIVENQSCRNIMISNDLNIQK